MGDLFDPLTVRDAVIAGWMAGIFISVGWTCQHLKNINENLGTVILLLRERDKRSEDDDD